MINRRTLAALATSAALAALWPSSTFAADPHKVMLGAPNCHGTVLGVGSSKHDANPGEFSHTFHRPVKDLQAEVRDVCGR